MGYLEFASPFPLIWLCWREMPFHCSSPPSSGLSWDSSDPPQPLKLKVWQPPALSGNSEGLQIPLWSVFQYVQLGSGKRHDWWIITASTPWFCSMFIVTFGADGADSTLTCSAISSQTIFAFLYSCNFSFKGSSALLSSSYIVRDRASTHTNKVSLAGGRAVSTLWQAAFCCKCKAVQYSGIKWEWMGQIYRKWTNALVT